MQNAINFFLGNVLVEVRGSYPERFFNLCARRGIEFWDMEIADVGVFYVRMTIANFRKLPYVAKKAMCKIHIVEKAGVPFFVNRFRKRFALIAGFAVFCVIAWIFTSFVWIIDIDGFAGLDTAKLRGLLCDYGLSTGVYSKSVNIAELKNNILIEMPELSYVSVNFNGSHAHVTARKRETPPEILEEDVPCDIIADKDGVIYDITVKSGTPAVSRGDTVTKGQILVSGYMTGRTGTTVTTHADADITVRTWRRLSSKIPKKYGRKVFTGDEKNAYTIILFGKRIKLYFNSGISYAKCDKIIRKNDLEIFGGIKLPVSLEKATYREYEVSAATLSDETAYDRLSAGLHEELDMPEDAEVADVDFKTSADERFAYASMTVEYIEKIGQKRKMLRDG